MSKNYSEGNVYIMKHSFFSDVIRIGCTPENPIKYAKELSQKSPGEYLVSYAVYCSNPCEVKKRLKAYLESYKCINDFYEVSADIAMKYLQRESMKIPSSSL